MPGWRVSGGPASRVIENHNGEFQALCLVYGHDPHAFDAFFNNLDWGVVNGWVEAYGIPVR